MNRHVSRRSLFRNTAWMAAAASLPRPLLAAAPAPQATAASTPIRLGIASYTFRNFDAAHLMDFMRVLHLRNLNLKDMHLPMKPAADVAARAAEFRAAGFNLEGAGNITFASTDAADIRAKFEYCKAAGIRTMVCAPTHETLPLLEPFVREYDIRLAIHNHGPEDKYFPSPLDVLRAVERMDRRIGCCIDVGHAMRAGADVPAAIRAAGPRLFDVHMKDLADRTAKESQVAVGQGVMPVREIFASLMAIGYPGYVDLEYEIKPADPLPGVIESMAYMRGVLAGMDTGIRGITS